jgi:hypothetical protein
MQTGIKPQIPFRKSDTTNSKRQEFLNPLAEAHRLAKNCVASFQALFFACLFKPLELMVQSQAPKEL